MSRPLLQLALDHSSLEAAQRDVTLLKDSVDIVESGHHSLFKRRAWRGESLARTVPGQNHRC